MLVVSSIFRDAAWYVDRYFEQIEELRDQVGDLRLVVAEGDSSDETWDLLGKHLGPDDVLVKAEHGGPKFGSVDDPDRWAQIAYVCNQLLDHVQVADTDRFLYVESDLGWSGHQIRRFIDNLDTVDAVAAMSFYAPTGQFYDTWGHIGLDGVNFGMHPPYHPRLDGLPPGALIEIGSAGSCIAITGRTFNQGVQFGREDCIRGYCRTIRAHTPLWLDTGVEVWHG